MRVLRKYLINGLSFGSFMFDVWPWRKRFARTVRKRLPTLASRTTFAKYSNSDSRSTTTIPRRPRFERTPSYRANIFFDLKLYHQQKRKRSCLNPLYIYIRIDVTSKSLVPRSYLPTTWRKIISSFCFLFAKFDFAMRRYDSIRFRIREKGEINRENIVFILTNSRKSRTKSDFYHTFTYRMYHGNELYNENLYSINIYNLNIIFTQLLKMQLYFFFWYNFLISKKYWHTFILNLLIQKLL